MIYLPSGQSIITTRGNIKTEEVLEGDKAYNHLGKYREIKPVKKVFQETPARTIKINGYCRPITLLADNKVYAYRGGFSGRKRENVEWISVKDLKVGDCIVYTVNSYDKEVFKNYTGNVIKNKALAIFLGYYALEGFIDDKKNRIVVFIDPKFDVEEDVIRSCRLAFDREMEAYDYNGERFVAVGDEEIIEYCKAFGEKNNETKKIPESILASNDEFLDAFMNGFFKMNKGKDGQYFRASSSLSMLEGFQRILLRMNSFANIYDCISKDSMFTYNAIVMNRKELSRIGSGYEDSWFRTNDMVFLKVENIKDFDYVGTVNELDAESCCCHIVPVK